jgi:hypothetical protein
MNTLKFDFWTCPQCVHTQELNLLQMTNRCQLIDQGESPVDGEVWEYQDHDICPAFKMGRNGK